MAAATGSASAQEMGLNKTQTDQVRDLVKEGMQLLDSVAQQQLDEVRSQLRQAGEAFAAQNLQYQQRVESSAREMDTKQEEVSLYVAQI